MELDKIIPADGPNINEVEKYINKYQSEVIVIKCGGSVLLDKKLFNQFIEDISVINKIGLSAIVVHGGGKNIKKKLDENNIETRFIKGLRVSDEKTIRYIEEALLELNLEILHELKSKNTNVCSISPKENNVINIIPESKELGYVGTPKKINKEKILNFINLIKKLVFKDYFAINFCGFIFSTFIFESNSIVRFVSILDIPAVGSSSRSNFGF